MKNAEKPSPTDCRCLKSHRLQISVVGWRTRGSPECLWKEWLKSRVNCITDLNILSHVKSPTGSDPRSGKAVPK